MSASEIVVGIVIYLSLGSLWVWWNGHSNSARWAMSSAEEHGNLPWAFAGMVLAVLLWPLGFLITILFMSRK